MNLRLALRLGNRISIISANELFGARDVPATHYLDRS